MINRLCELREKRGFSQAELAEKTGTTFQSISRWERGERGTWMAKQLPKLADALGVDVYEIFVDPDELKRKHSNGMNLELVKDASLVLYEMVKKNKKDPSPEQFSKMLVQLCKIGMDGKEINRSNVVDMFEFAEAMRGE